MLLVWSGFWCVSFSWAVFCFLCRLETGKQVNVWMWVERRRGTRSLWVTAPKTAKDRWEHFDLTIQSNPPSRNNSNPMIESYRISIYYISNNLGSQLMLWHWDECDIFGFDCLDFASGKLCLLCLCVIVIFVCKYVCFILYYWAVVGKKCDYVMALKTVLWILCILGLCFYPQTRDCKRWAVSGHGKAWSGYDPPMSPSGWKSTMVLW